MVAPRSPGYLGVTQNVSGSALFCGFWPPHSRGYLPDFVYSVDEFFGHICMVILQMTGVSYG